MRTQILLLLIPLGLLGCSSAHMLVDENLVSTSDKYNVSERPSAFSGDKLIVGPYSATNIDRSGISSSGSGIRISGIGSYSEKNKNQNFSYHFKGKHNWTSKCKVKGGSSTIGNVLSKENMGIFCNFSPENGTRSPSSRSWKFSFEGFDLISATGSFKVRTKTVRVVATNKIKDSAFSHGKPTGYFFYVGKRIVAGVDVINSKGPVWIEKKLAADMKDAIGIVAVALLLNQM